MATEDKIVTGQITLIEVNDGGQGDPGVDANMLDWVKDWNSNLTMIDSTMVVTPKIFAGVKNSDNTLTGVALGCFSLSVKEDSGAIVTEQIDGVYSFCGGYKTFSLDSSGNVEVGRGSQSIKYNSTTGKIEFGVDVSMAWVGATYIDSNGIFTGSLSANTVNAISITATQITSGYISSDRIAAGSIAASKLDATSIKSEIINTDYINGLSCTFTRGSIGGWTIADGTLSSGQIAISAVYKRVVVYGSSSGVASGHRVQLYYNSDADFGFYATNSLGASIVQLGSTNQIAGWQITASAIYKNSVYLGSDGSIYNSGKWTLANDGSGSLASGNISWDASGNVTFGSSVSLNWTSAVSSALTEAKTYTDTAKSSAISTAAADATTKSDAAAELATAMAYGKMLYRDPTFSLGTNSTYVYNNLGNGSVTVTRTYDSSAPNDSKYVLRIVKTSVSASPESGGFSFQTMTAYRKIYITRIYAKIPSGRSIGFASNSVGTGGSYKWLTDTAGTGDWKEYIAKVTCGTASFSTTNFYYISGSTEVSWDVAYATVFDITSVESSCTTIDANGIYTGSISATQITAGTINAARIDTDSLKASLITAANINALTLTTTTGYIGGWSVTSTSIAKNSVSLGADGTISNSTKWSLKNDGSGFIASGNISWDSAGTVTFSSTVALQWTSKIDSLTTSLADVTDNAKTTTLDLTSLDENTYYPVIMALGTSKRANILLYNTLGSSSKPSWATHTYGFACECEWNTIGSGWGTRTVVRSVLRSSYSWSSVLPFGNITQMTNSSFEVIYLRGGGVYYFKTTNVGSIFYVTSTYTSNTQSVAPISSVTQPVADVDQINTALGGTSYPKLTYIDSTGIYTGTLTATQVNAVAINASSITTGTLNADRIATGSIYATKLNAASIQSDIINATYINGLTCTFTKGTVGGWSIGSDNITAGTIGGDGQMPMQLRTTSSGSGYWYSGAYKPFGVSMTWHKSNNAGHIVIGQVASAGNGVKTGFMGIQMMSWDHLEYFCLSANYTLYGSKEIYNRIAGWAFDSASIWKGYVYLGSDGSIYNSASKWKLANDGSGYIASGNISWDASGNVSFSSSVALNWTTLINQGKLYVRGTGYNNSTSRVVILNGATIVNNWSRGLAVTVISRDTLTHVSTTYYDVYADETYCTTMATQLDSLSASYIVVVTSYDAIRVNATLSTALQRCGASDWTTGADRIPYALIGIPTIGKNNGIEARFTSSATDPYAEMSTTIENGVPLGVNTNGKMLTYISGTGIYTGTLTADQITAGTINAARIDTASIQTAILTATNVNALTLTTTKGTIGGWNISSSYIYKNTVYFGSDGSIYNGTKWKLNYDGSGQLANGNISWDTSGSITAKNAIFTNVRVQGSVRNPFVLNDSSIWIGGDSSDQTNFNNYDNIIAVNTGSWTSYIPLPWTLENSGRRITLVNYKWSTTESTGYMGISAPTGQYFYEDGIAKTAISFSRECLELLGYGDSSTFFGWIVLNRINLMTTSRYGKPLRVLAQGLVTGTSSSASISYKTFDNTTMSVSRTGTGKYVVYFSALWGLNATNAVFNLTGYGYSYGSTTGPIKAAIYGVYGSFFYVNTSDDSTNNDGSFYFQITNMNDWTY